MRELQADPLPAEQVGDPVPARRRLPGGGLVSAPALEGGEVLAQRLAAAGQLLLPGDGAVLADGGEVGGSFVQVDAGVVRWGIHEGPPVAVSGVAGCFPSYAGGGPSW